jgi:alkylhydroperoxidase family enzyme
MNHGRLPWPSRDELDAGQAELYDAIVGGPRAASRAFPMTNEEGRMYGPFNAMLLEPIVGSVVSELGEVLRYRSVLADRLREIAILEVAVACRSEFEWFAHAAVARRLEITEADLEALKDDVAAPGLATDEVLARRLARSLVENRDLSDEEYAAAVEVLGLAQLADLIFLVGFYSTIATALASFRVPLPPGIDAVFS